MSHVDGIVRIDEQGDRVIHLFLICVVELVEGLELGHVAGMHADKLALVHTVRKYEFERAAHVKERRIVPAFRLTSLLRLDAADNVVLARILQGESSAHQRRDNHLVVVIGRQAYAGTRQSRRMNQKVVRAVVPYADGQGRLRQLHMQRCGDAHERKVVRNIHPFRVLPANDQVLEQAISRKTLRARRVAAFIQVVEFNPNAVDEFLRKFAGDLAALDILTIIRIHVLVEPAGRNGVPARLDLQQLLHEPEGLARLPEIARSVFGNVLAVICDAEQFRFAPGIRLLRRHFPRQRRISLCIDDCRFAAHDHRIQEVRTARIFGVAEVQLIKSFFRLCGDPFESDRENPIVMHGDVPDAVIKIVAGREHIMIDSTDCLGSHIRSRQFARCFPLPILIRFRNFLFCFL